MDKVKNFKELDFPPPVGGKEHDGECDCPSASGGYMCTLDRGHDGNHEAAGLGNRILATWEDE